MDKNEAPVWKLPLVLAIVAGGIAKCVSHDDRLVVIAAIVVFVYAAYLGMVYRDSGKSTMVEKLKEDAFMLVSIVAFGAASIWLTGVISGWFGLEGFLAKFLIWILLMISTAIIVVVTVVPKNKK